ncbi:unnamed protein product [Rotaria sp. Silwood2]|nr:unnamed protein product [Rotaria sp. Silwood2]CAF2496196.1 unnamed protein product [Rotaria sp. Silwood2]CAF3340753.1 unnamed protein product [Rotaria sp. Silwood2]CAF3413780.1 unnamed protein product [Rotaria sp. Silwood2]CAF4246704.1 unnamed protein product [Rotaria sp. Silwood2]
MASTILKNSCVKCKKTKHTVKCGGCSQDFCLNHMNEHHNELSEQLGTIEDQFNEFNIEIDGQKADPQKHGLMKQIDEWELESIEKIRQTANKARRELSWCMSRFVTDMNVKLKQLNEQITQCRKQEDFSDPDIQFFNEKLERLKETLNKPPYFKVEQYSTSFISKIHLAVEGK